MPGALIVSDATYVPLLVQGADAVKTAIARHLSTWRKHLTSSQVSLRFLVDSQSGRIAPVELEIFAHVFLTRLWHLDERARLVAEEVARISGAECSCWINLGFVGYAPAHARGAPPTNADSA